MTTSPQKEPLHSVDEARRRIVEVVDALGPVGEVVSFLPSAEGRVLAEELRARRDLPAFDNSAMDGVGVRVDDVKAAPVALKLVGSSLPGGPAHVDVLQPGQAVRIMTGGPIPPGVEALVMREHTDESRVDEGVLRVLEAAPPGQHIRRRGEDVSTGDVVGSPGDLLTPARMNLLLSAGHATARVARRPVVAIVASGDELREVGLPLGDKDVVNSNAHAVAAAARELGCEVHLLGIARDSLEDHARRMSDALFADVLITIGGVSMGTHDFVRPALEQMGATLEMWRVAMRPGKPIAFGRRARAGARDLLVFGLPGNPVSSMVSFELFVRPALRRLVGLPGTTRPLWAAELVDSQLKKKKGLEHWARGVARLQRGRLKVRLEDAQGSHHVSAMARANALVRAGADVELVDAGSEVEVMLLAEPVTDADRY
jgi:molybdopterin molybdotransferase